MSPAAELPSAPDLPILPLESERLILEPLEERHAPVLFESFCEPDLYTYIRRSPPASVARLALGFRRLESRRSPDEREAWLNWAARLKTAPTYICTFEATVYPDGRAHLAYSTFKPYWRHGFAREGCRAVIADLFGRWGVQQVVIEMDTENQASVRLAESLGAVRIEHNLEADFIRGRPSDEYRYVLSPPG